MVCVRDRVRSRQWMNWGTQEYDSEKSTKVDKPTNRDAGMVGLCARRCEGGWMYRGTHDY